jgi:hypothetical protein
MAHNPPPESHWPRSVGNASTRSQKGDDVKNETISALEDDYIRGRLQAIQDLIGRLDGEAGRYRATLAAMAKEVGEEMVAENILVKVRAAVTQERLTGFVAATEVAVKMFAEEAKPHQEPSGESGAALG